MQSDHGPPGARGGTARSWPVGARGESPDTDDRLHTAEGAHETHGSPSRSPPRAVFRGTTAELTTLRALLAQVHTGRGQVVGIVGEPGIGKSRLLAEWRQRLADRALTSLEGRCPPIARARPIIWSVRCSAMPVPSPRRLTRRRSPRRCTGTPGDGHAPCRRRAVSAAPPGRAGSRRWTPP